MAGKVVVILSAEGGEADDRPVVEHARQLAKARGVFTY